jgi:hypothetical protein
MRPQRPLPDFIIGGAPRCGTTYLHAQMEQHPRICMAVTKEPWYFVEAPEPEGILKLLHIRTRGYHHRGWSWYRAQFARCDSERVLGEASVGYLHSPESARLIRSSAPDVRLIFMLRDPVDRIVSQYLRDLRYRRLPPLEDMIASHDSRLMGWIDASSYARHLERFYATFARDQVLVLFLEDLRLNHEAVVANAYAFVGVDASFVPPRVTEPVNPTGLSRSRLLAQVFAVRPLPFPRMQRSWNGLAAFVARYNRKTVPLRVAPEVRAALWPLLREDAGRLSDVIGRDVPYLPLPG